MDCNMETPHHRERPPHWLAGCTDAYAKTPMPWSTAQMRKSQQLVSVSMWNSALGNAPKGRRPPSRRLVKETETTDTSPVVPNPPCQPPKVAGDDGKEEGEAEVPMHWRPHLGAPQW